jgi:hypothetical protein
VLGAVGVCIGALGYFVLSLGIVLFVLCLGVALFLPWFFDIVCMFCFRSSLYFLLLEYA